MNIEQYEKKLKATDPEEYEYQTTIMIGRNKDMFGVRHLPYYKYEQKNSSILGYKKILASYSK